MTQRNLDLRACRIVRPFRTGVTALAIACSALSGAASGTLAQSASPGATAVPVDGSILPFPPTPSDSTPGLTIQDSIYKKRVEPRRLAADVPNILIILLERERIKRDTIKTRRLQHHGKAA